MKIHKKYVDNLIRNYMKEVVGMQAYGTHTVDERWFEESMRLKVENMGRE